MTIEREIAEAKTALNPEQVARIIFKSLFERGPNRLSAENAAIARGVIQVSLHEWRKQLLTAAEDGAGRWKKLYEATKAELDEVKLRLAIFEKEQ